MFIIPMEPVHLFAAGNMSDATKILPQSGGSLPFQDVLAEAIANTEATQKQSQIDGTNVAFGNMDDLSQLNINSFKAETALKTAVDLTTRVVSAYKEVMQMSV